MLTIEDVQEKLSMHRNLLASDFNVESLHAFGSVVKGEATLSSDIDILVDFKGPADFITFMKLKEFLTQLLDMSVDLVTRKALRPALKTSIEDEAVRVA